jgi:hypothetical protein
MEARSTINDRLLAGTYGATYVISGVRYADLAEVERVHGPFSDAQLAAAGDGGRARLITLEDMHVAAA